MIQMEKYSGIIGKYLTIGLAACYVSGFFITNLYLGQFQVANIDIIKPVYLFRGFVFILFVIVTIYPSIVLIRDFRKIVLGKNQDLATILFLKKILKFIILSFILSEIFILYFGFKIGEPVYNYKIHLSENISNIVAKGIFFSGLININFVMSGATYVLLFLLIFEYIKITKIGNKIGKSFSFLIYFCIFLSLTFSYSYKIYPKLLQQYGGGNMLPIYAVFDDSKLNESMNNDAKSLYLIEKTSESSLFLLADHNYRERRIFEIPNNRIKEIVYLNPIEPVAVYPYDAWMFDDIPRSYGPNKGFQPY